VDVGGVGWDVGGSDACLYARFMSCASCPSTEYLRRGRLDLEGAPCDRFQGSTAARAHSGVSSPDFSGSPNLSIRLALRRLTAEHKDPSTLVYNVPDPLAVCHFPSQVAGHGLR